MAYMDKPCPKCGKPNSADLDEDWGDTEPTIGIDHLYDDCPYVECDDKNCRALKDPRAFLVMPDDYETYIERLCYALEHWKSHSNSHGCSHGN